MYLKLKNHAYCVVFLFHKDTQRLFGNLVIRLFVDSEIR